ncbi:MAG: flagellin, partial [Thiotrichales bacterium]
ELRANATIRRGITDGVSLVQVAEGALAGIQSLLQRARELAVQAANGIIGESSAQIVAGAVLDTPADPSPNGSRASPERGALDRELRHILEEIPRITDATTPFEIKPLREYVPPSPPDPPEVPQPWQLPATQPLLGNVRHLGDMFWNGDTTSYPSGIVPTAYIPAGATGIRIEMDAIVADDDIQVFTRDGKHLVGTPISGPDPDFVWSANAVVGVASADALVLTEAKGFLAGATYDDAQLVPGSGSTTYNGMTLTYSGDGDQADSVPNDGRVDAGGAVEILEIDQTTEDLILMSVGTGAFYVTATWASMPGDPGSPPPPPPTPPWAPPPPPEVFRPIEIVTDAPFGGEIKILTLARTPTDTRTLGIDTITFDTAESSRAAMNALSTALETVSGYRAYYGAMQSRFESAMSELEGRYTGLSASRSRILDADYAAETAKLTRTQILQQGGIAMLGQANQLPQSVLRLLG